MGKINDDVKGSALIRDGRIATSDVQDKAITTEKLADEVTASMLPEVDDEDAGKTVVVSEEGKWEVGEASGGGGGGSGGEMLTVQFSYDDYITEEEIGQNNITAYSTEEYTASELATAWNDGKTIKAVALPEDNINDTPQECLITSFKEDQFGNIVLWGTSYVISDSSMATPFMWRIENYEIEEEGETFNLLVLSVVGPTGD